MINSEMHDHFSPVITRAVLSFLKAMEAAVRVLLSQGWHSIAKNTGGPGWIGRDFG